MLICYIMFVALVLLAPSSTTAQQTSGTNPDILEMFDSLFHKDLSTDDDEIVGKESDLNKAGKKQRRDLFLSFLFRINS